MNTCTGKFKNALGMKNTTTQDAKGPFFSERAWLLICLALGAVQAWILRYSMISDGVSYLDVADAYFRGDWSAAINGHWSPLYSWCLGVALYVFKPSIWWEFTTVHIVNLVIYIGALFSFRFFFRSVLRSLKERASTSSDQSLPLSENVLVALGYGVFLWSSLVLIDLGRVTPDLLATALVFLMMGYLVELRDRPSKPEVRSAGPVGRDGISGQNDYVSHGIVPFGDFAVLSKNVEAQDHRFLDFRCGFSARLLDVHSRSIEGERKVYFWRCWKAELRLLGLPARTPDSLAGGTSGQRESGAYHKKAAEKPSCVRVRGTDQGDLPPLGRSIVLE